MLKDEGDKTRLRDQRRGSRQGRPYRVPLQTHRLSAVSEWLSVEVGRACRQLSWLTGIANDANLRSRTYIEKSDLDASW